MNFEELRHALETRQLFPIYKGRWSVALCLAEAEAVRCLPHRDSNLGPGPDLNPNLHHDSISSPHPHPHLSPSALTFTLTQVRSLLHSATDAPLMGASSPTTSLALRAPDGLLLGTSEGHVSPPVRTLTLTLTRHPHSRSLTLALALALTLALASTPALPWP